MLEEQESGLFLVHGSYDYVTYDKKSLYLLDHTYRLRYALVWLIEWVWFDRFITIVIILNSILFATHDFTYRFDPEYDSWINKIEAEVDLIFSFIFIGECIIKILAMGLIIHKHAYLRDTWNILDLIIVIISIISMHPATNSDSLKALRTFRVLKPLRSIKQLPTMKSLI